MSWTDAVSGLNSAVTDTFGETATHAASADTWTAVLTTERGEVDGVQVVSFRLHQQTANLPAIAIDDEISVDSTAYKILAREDDQGATDLWLEKL